MSRLLALFGQTSEEKAAYRNALSLFFGGLLGANLGLLQTMPLETYVTVSALLAGTVMAFVLVGRARSRRYAVVTLALYGTATAYAYFRTDLFGSLDPAATERLFATLGMWLVAMAIVELTPIVPGRGRRGPDVAPDDRSS